MSAKASEPSVVIAGGGTGGHLFPGLALADELRSRGVRVSFVGTARGLEAKVVPQAGYPLSLIDVAGLKGKGISGTLRGLFRLPLSLVQSVRLLRHLRPSAVVGVGGYASGPVVLLAALLGIPTAILEQNSVPGITNRILGRVVRRVIIAFPGARRFFPEKAILPLGNPIRAAVLQAGNKSLQQPAPAPGAPLRVLVLGGSQGAHAVNELVAAAIETWAKGGPEKQAQLTTQLSLRHQTGAKDRDAVQARYRALGLGEAQARAEEFISDMGAAYAACDLVVGRAGATTLAELTAIGRPALLIPFPQAADDHQTENARFLVDEGAALLFPQATTTPAALCDELQRLCSDRARLAEMAARCRTLGRPDAAQAIADEVLRLAGLADAGALAHDQRMT
jgi:UDP-N-acetylglucosamine--N-acetylmuramyl-(pentapeptide) pyrophosphoryl-undecaprenol N-acetylglucosamine transferase